MSALKCPGQDSRYLKPQDVTEVVCEQCGGTVEFWPDEYVRSCRGCGRRIANPRLDLRCLEWCEHAEACIAGLKEAKSGGSRPSGFERRPALDRMRTK